MEGGEHGPRHTAKSGAHAKGQELEVAGVPQKQAEAQIKILSPATSVSLDGLATKQDLHSEIATVRAELRELELRMTIKLGSIMVVGIGVMVAAVKFL